MSRPLAALLLSVSLAGSLSGSLSCSGESPAPSPDATLADAGGGDAAVSAPPSPADTLEPRVAALVDAAGAGGSAFPAVIVAVSEGDELRLRLARGLDSSGAPTDPNARGRIGSATKAFVALAVLRRVDAGTWSLDTPLTELLPDVEGLDGVSLGHALSHTSGLPDLIDASLFDDILATPDRVWTDAELAARGLAKPRVGAPGERFVYANTNYHLLGMALERDAQSALAELLAAEILGPLALLDTRYPSGAALPRPHLEGSIDGFSTTTIDPSYAGAAGAMDATAADLLRFGRAYGRGELLDTDTLRPVAQPYFDASELGVPGLEYGHGVMRIDGWYGHAGDVLGYGSVVLHHPELDRTVAVLATGDFGNAFFLGARIASALDAGE